MINGTQYVGVVAAMNEILFNLGPNSEYWSLMPQLTRFMAQQQMLCTLFAFPAIALAMYNSAKEENKKMVKPLLITLWMTAFLGNVTEPLEFTFVFIAPMLYVIYAIIIGVGAVALSFFNVAIGYIRGTIFDFAIFGLMYEKTNWVSFVMVGLVLAVVTYFVFYWFINKFDVKTPGREDESNLDNRLIQEKNYTKIAEYVVQGLGGKDNIEHIDNCITRLRIDLKDTSLIDKDILMESGTTGIFLPSKNHIHIVFGPLVEFVRNAVDDEARK